MDNVDYKIILSELISGLKYKPEILRTVSQNSLAYNEKHFEGMKFAYHMMMDEVVNHLESYDLDLEDFGLEDYNTSDILDIQPMG